MEQIDKNTVSAQNQLKSNEYIRFTDPQNTGIRVMFLGNSITLHGIKPEIGWHGFHGMAASAEDKDYAHILMKHIRGIDPNAAFCICQGAHWEVHYREGNGFYEMFEPARDFAADVIIMRLVENCSRDGFDCEVFKTELMSFLKYLSSRGNARIILTTGFWHHIGDNAIKELAKENGFDLVELGDLGEDDSMKAIGLFEHEGVANHPGDKGMQAIADRIFECFKR